MKQFIQNLIDKIKGGFQAVEHGLEKYTPQALHVATVFANILDNPIAEGVLSLVVGATTAEEIEVVVLAAVKDLTIAESILSLPTAEEQLKALAKVISVETKDSKNALIIKLGQLVLKYLDGNKQAGHIYDTTLQVAYSESKAA